MRVGITPQWFFEQLDAEFHFALDAAASPDNAKCKRYWTVEDDALKQSWRGHRIFCNPPYDRATKTCPGIMGWVTKAITEVGLARLDKSAEAKTLVALLLPADTSTAWFHAAFRNSTQQIFTYGRLQFEDYPDPSKFGSVVFIFSSEQLPREDVRFLRLNRPKKVRSKVNDSHHSQRLPDKGTHVSGCER